MILACFGSQGFFYTPPSFYPTVKSSDIYTILPRKHRNSLLYPLPFIVNVFSFVIALLRICSPSAIFRTIVSVYVDAINTMLWRRTFTHIGKKILKRVTPTVANSYTTCAVVFIMAIVRVVTFLLYRLPCFIFGRFRRSVCNFVHSTSATFSYTAAQRIATYGFLFSAITLAYPFQAFCSFWINRHNYQPAKSLTSQIYRLVLWAQCGILKIHQSFLSGVMRLDVSASQAQLYLPFLSISQGGI